MSCSYIWNGSGEVKGLERLFLACEMKSHRCVCVRVCVMASWCSALDQV